MTRTLLTRKFIIGILVTLAMITGIGINYAVGVDGPETKELTLQEAVYLAMNNNPDIEIAQYSVEKAKIEYDGAKYSAGKINVEDVSTYQAGLLKWVNPKAAEIGLVIAEKSKEVAEKNLKLQVETAYYNVLKADRNLAILREGLKYFNDQLKIAQTAYKIGTKAKVDVITIESAVAGYQAQVTGAENSYRTAVMELNKLMGLDLDAPLKLTTKFALEKIGDSIKLEETLKQALEDNLEILSVKKGLELKEVQYDVAKKFYGGGVTVYDTAKVDTKIAEANIRKQELATTAVVKQSYLTLFTLEKMIDYQNKEVEKSAENSRIFALKYEAGLATGLDLKKANIDLEEAEGTLTDTIYKYNLLKSQFKYKLFYTGAPI